MTRLFFSAVKMGRVSGLSMVWMRRSRNTTFWNGGGSFHFRPGSWITSLISPSAYTTATWRWSTTKSVDDSNISASSAAPTINAMRFMFLFSCPALAAVTVAAALVVARANVDSASGRGGLGGRRRCGSGGRGRTCGLRDEFVER